MITQLTRLTVSNNATKTIKKNKKSSGFSVYQYSGQIFKIIGSFSPQLIFSFSQKSASMVLFKPVETLAMLWFYRKEFIIGAALLDTCSDTSQKQLMQ